MWFLRVLCLLLPSVLCAADDWHQALHRIRQTVDIAVGRSDNYICVQDLARFYYLAPTSAMACRQPPAIPSVPKRVEDRLKLDVAVSQGSEIYSWHGEHKFSASSVGDVVRQGPIASGSFNGYLRNIFGERGVVFIYRGRSTLNGTAMDNFEYEVPLAASHYEIQSGKAFEVAPFHGSFSARTDTSELYSLTVTANAEDVSLKASICSAQTTLTYQLVKISDHESLLPASFDLLIGSRNGIFTESKGRYSECREYKGESTVRFDLDETSTTNAAAPDLQLEPLRSGLILGVALRGEIDEDSAYAGMPVEAVLTHAVKLNKGSMLARGAILRGTITSFEIIREPTHQVSLKIEFNSITDGTKLYLCKATHHVMPSLYQANSPGRGRRMAPGVNSIAFPEDGTLVFESRHVHLDKNFTSQFITVGHPEDAQ